MFGRSCEDILTVREQHLTPSRIEQIIDDNSISSHEAEHAKTCPACNGWLRSFIGLAILSGANITFEVPPALSAEGREQKGRC
jgi:hypothetical protein